jgi:hypothetical protein
MLAASLPAAAILAQTAPPPAFDVAPIRPSPAERRGGEAMLGENIKVTPGSLSMRRVSLKALHRMGVFEYQVNGPDWIGSRTYDVMAKLAVRPPNQSSGGCSRLCWRIVFHLPLHRQTKEMRTMLHSLEYWDARSSRPHRISCTILVSRKAARFNRP